MGAVFRAHDTKLDREVAVKLLNLRGEKAEAALLHEAQCLARLSGHPNVVTVYDTGKVDDDLFLAMEFVPGINGRHWFNKYYPTCPQAINAFLAAGRGLAAVHAAGLEHCDFKPENVLVATDGRVRVVDFGVARVLRDHVDDGDGDDTLMDDASGPLGTTVYMAPERLRGRRGDARADQFSFCVTMWESLFAFRPFTGETATELLTAIEHGHHRGLNEVGDAKIPGGLPGPRPTSRENSLSSKFWA